MIYPEKDGLFLLKMARALAADRRNRRYSSKAVVQRLLHLTAVLCANEFAAAHNGRGLDTLREQAAEVAALAQRIATECGQQKEAHSCQRAH